MTGRVCSLAPRNNSEGILVRGWVKTRLQLKAYSAPHLLRMFHALFVSIIVGDGAVGVKLGLLATVCGDKGEEGRGQ